MRSREAELARSVRSVQGRAVLIDDQELTRTAVRHALLANGFDVVGEADGLEAGLQTVLDERPDVVMIDITLGGVARPSAIEQVLSIGSNARVLVLTAHRDPRCLLEALRLGACGYVLKHESCDAIVRAVRAAVAGQSVISSEITRDLLASIRESSDGDATQDADAIRAALTTRELDILTRLAGGERNRDIGDELCLSEHTVKNHVASILAKLHLANRTQAAAHAIRAGLSCLIGAYLALGLDGEADLASAIVSSFAG
jgi:DNA-binding NarL/FixJ family response regulator